MMLLKKSPSRFLGWRRYLLLSLLLMLLSPGLHAREKVGVVLSGGGARGLAHVGVLKLLEQQQIPVDYIVGTSMGSIIAGLYASGKNADEIEQLVLNTDWDEGFTDDSPRSELSFRRKEDDSSFPIDLNLGLRDGELQLPKGVIQGQRLGLLLQQLFSSSAFLRDFDQLPIPYRAVATDIETGEAVVLKQGYLAEAVHASMAVPGIYAPVKIDGHWLVDGGVANNMPVDVVRAMGADVVIAVDISSPKLSSDNIESVVNVVDQLTNILISRNVAEQSALITAKDLLIRPDMGTITSTDFQKAEQAISRGYQAAQQQMKGLDAFRVSAADYQHYQQGVKPLPEQQPVIERIVVRHYSRRIQRLVQGRLLIQAGEKLDLNRLKKTIGRIYGTGYFERVSYELVDSPQGAELHLIPQEKSWGPAYLRFSVQIEDDLQSNNVYNLGLNYTKTGINSLGAEWRFLAQSGSSPSLKSEFYQPITEDGRYFVSADVFGREMTIEGFSDRNIERTFRVNEAGGSVAFGRQFSNEAELKLTLNRSTGKVKQRVGSPAMPSYDFEKGWAGLELTYDTLDTSQIPRNGHFVTGTLGFSRAEFGADEDFDELRLMAVRAKSWGSQTLVGIARFNSMLDSELDVENSYSLGGFLNLSGYNQQELTGRHTAMAGLAYLKAVNSKAFSDLDFPFFLGGSVEAGGAWEQRDDIALDNAIAAGSLFIGAETPIGPVYLAYGRAEENHRAFYFFLGRGFR